MTRPVVTTIDSILWILKDYCKSEDVPDDATAIKLMIDPADKSRIAILAESDTWTNSDPLNISFDIRRMYGPAKAANPINR